MKIRSFEVEATPDEISQVPELREALRRLGAGESLVDQADVELGVPTGPVGAFGELPKELSDFIAVRAGNRSRAEVTSKFVSEVLGWGTTTAELGTSKTTSDGFNNYLMLYAKGPRKFGAFAYVMPGQAKVMLRLTAEDAVGFDHADIRNVKEGTGYVVTVTIDSDGAYDEALALAKVALERVQT